MGPFHREKTECENCHVRFRSYDDLIKHAKEVHKRHIVRCSMCGRQFLHEKDRLHHIQEEKEKKIDARTHKF
jgi:hydrogenase maturation factor HypF (carbamoyltransferase family)